MHDVKSPYAYQPFPQNWTLEGVEIWSADKAPFVADLAFERGRVSSITPTPLNEQGKAANFALMPAGVDIQVHLRVPGQGTKETAETGMLASLMGGLAGVVTMPNTKPVIDTPAVVAQAQGELREWESKFGIRAFFTAALSVGQRGEVLCDYEALAASGVVAFTDDGVGLANDNLMRESLRLLAKIDKALFQHAETPGHGGVLAPGPVQAKLGVKPYPADPEISMVKRDLELLASVPGARYHLLHVSSEESIRMIADAKRRGLKATVEVSPHHLWWSTEDIDPSNSSFKMNPPIRTPRDREALQVGLADGTIDWVATDHAPHEAEAKTLDFAKASFGTLGVETSLPVLLALHAQQKLTAQRLVEVFARRPSRFLGLVPTDGWGEVQVGAQLRAVLVDKTAPWRAWTANDHHSRSKNSCFAGTRLPERPVFHFTQAGVFGLSRAVEFRDGKLSF